MNLKALSTAAIFFVATAVAPAFAAEAPKAPSGDRDASKSVTGGDSPRGGMTDTSRGADTRGMSSTDQDKSAFQQAGFHKSSDVVGKKVVSQNGEDLGNVEDLIIGNDGKVQYIVLSEGGVLGIGGRLIPVPWQAANLRMQNDQLTASIDKQQLQNAPSINNDQWAQLASPGYEQQVNSYFGSTPQSGSQPGSMNR